MNTVIQMMFPCIPCMIFNKSDTSSSNSNLYPFKRNFKIKRRSPAAEIMQLSHAFEGRLNVQPGVFWKGLHNETEVLFHILPGNTASHESWYSSTHYRMTQHHMNVGTVPHITGWHITWMLVQLHTLLDNTTSHECWYSSTHYRMTQHHTTVGTVPHITR